MTKFEWELELAKNLKRLPASESSKILDYYNELFLDKIDAGLNEKEIIKSFGNPFDVAYKIVYGFEENIKEPLAHNTPLDNLDTIVTQNDNLVLDQELPAASDAIDTIITPVTLTVAPIVYAPAINTKKRKSTGGVIARLIFFIPFFAIFITLWTIVITFIASGVGMSIGGLASAVFSLIHIGTYSTAAYASIGLGLAASGIGLLLLVFIRPITKGTVRLTQKYFYIGKHKTAKRDGEKL
ncbi:MAG: DUF1700 domain-containing protein [Firmicutes bacterium]|nr:DUF1700 domain-containing protein [Bacillota bacterium]